MCEYSGINVTIKALFLWCRSKLKKQNFGGENATYLSVISLSVSLSSDFEFGSGSLYQQMCVLALI